MLVLVFRRIKGHYVYTAHQLTLLDPARLAHARALLPADLAPAFDQLVGAARLGLAGTLHDLFLIAALVATVALVASVFLREVPLTRTAQKPAEMVEEAA